MKGFTLIELLVVLAIVATLLSIVAPRYVHQVDKAQDAALRENLVILRQALDHYYADKDHYPDSLQALVEERYLRKLPVDPWTRRNDSWETVTEEDSGISRVIDVLSGASGTAADGTDYRSW
ncbi:type II secretion system protein G [Pseudomonas azotoformans]|uniref:Type II secretion system protein G n=1 Tax=Pseudomonas azotoformans TaxID=47878 RepID=A0A140GWM5_PSEAZ|nr:type II secretion system protein G [Pseudomonas azotoformans]